jgi:carboxymethylenebutenolidase
MSGGGSMQWRDEKASPENRRFGERISFGKRRDAGTGYFSYSDRVGPSVLLLHEWFGLTPSFEAYADALNHEGFTVLVPDLYDGVVAKDIDDAERLSGALDKDRMMRMLRAAAAHLTDNWHPRLGTVGFSLGAMASMTLAQVLPVEATVIYYGTGDANPDRWHGSLLGHFASTDEFEDLAWVRSSFQTFSDAGIEAELQVYEGTGHWFANRDVPDAYEPAAAQLAWTRTVDFLRHHLA